MSVVYGDRGLSKTEYWRQMRKIEIVVTNLLLHDFGVKDRTREPQFYADVMKMEENDAQIFLNICEKYNIRDIRDHYPEWLVETYRQRAINKILDAKDNIRGAYDIYPYFEREFYDRRKYQDDAIRNCGQIYDILTSCANTFPVNKERYMKIVEMVERESELLREWRKHDNVFLREIKKRDKRQSDLQG